MAGRQCWRVSGQVPICVILHVPYAAFPCPVCGHTYTQVPWKLVLGDAIATVIERAIMYPLETVRTRMEMDTDDVAVLTHVWLVTRCVFVFIFFFIYSLRYGLSPGVCFVCV